ncbi:hypothetical protein J6590_076918 [Homalodisca vitripennis]|nr:hypothetical protein J6590_076918 [Homalodisca vitripennis]
MYGIAAWGGTSKKNMDRILILKKRAIRTIAGINHVESCLSKPFADFVDNELNRNISDFDLSDEDDIDADPNFLPEAVKADQDSSDEEDVETAEPTLEQNHQQPGTSRSSLGTERIFWKKNT